MARRKFSGIGFLDVEDERVTLPSNIGAFISWFDRGQSQECLWTLGHLSGMAIFPPSELLARQKLRTRVQSIQLRTSQIGSPLARAALAERIGWEISLQKQGRIHLPALAREMGLLPDKEVARIGLTAYGGILHFWKQEEMKRELTTLIPQWSELRAVLGSDEDEDQDEESG